MTMTLVSTITLPSDGTSLIEFTSVPQTGKDLYLVLSARGSTGIGFVKVLLNTDVISSANYSGRTLEGNGSTVTSGINNSNGLDIGWTTNIASTFSNHSACITNYTASTMKTLLADAVSENNATTAYESITGHTWNNTAAVTKVSIAVSNSPFAAQTTASLYTISTTGATGATVA